MKRLLRVFTAFGIAAAAMLSIAPAAAQSGCSYAAYGAVLTAGQWNECLKQKQNALGFVPVNRAGDVMLGRLTTMASQSSGAGFNIPQGQAPTNPQNGDVWTTISGMFARINGMTIGPFSESSSTSFAAVAPLSVSFPSSITTYALNADANFSVVTDALALSTDGIAYPHGVSGGAKGNGTINLGASGLYNAGTAPSGTGGGYVLSAAPTVSDLSVTGSFSAPGLVTNSSLETPSTTVNGQTCTLGASCTITASATSITVGTTAVDGGSTGRVLYDNAGVLGELTVTGSGSAVLASSPTIASPTFSGTVAGANTVPLSVLAQSGANTMLGNWTGSAANVVANTMPNCADSGGNHLNYINGTGIVCGTSTGAAAAGTLTGTNLASNVVSSSLTSVGTLTGGATGAGFTVNLASSTISGTLPGANFPALTGDVTTTAGSLTTAIGAGKVTSSMLNADVYSTAHTWSAAQDFSGQVLLSGVITPAQITSDQNDYAPSGLSSVSTLRLSSDAARSITGLVGGSGGRVIIVHNIGANPITLINQNTGSTADNRFSLGADTVLAADTSITLQYDGGSSRWRAITTPGSGGGGGSGTVTSVTCNGGTTIITTSGICQSRELLTADRTYYVRTDGSDSNNGLSNTSGGAFLTLQKAIDTVASIDISIFNVTIQLASGTYSSGSAATYLKSIIGSGAVTIIGDIITPSNVVITSSATATIYANAVSGNYVLRGFKITNTVGHSLQAMQAPTSIAIGDLDFGASGQWHIVVARAAYVSNIDYLGNTLSYIISGSASGHILLFGGGNIGFGNGNPGAPASSGNITENVTFSNVFIACSTCSSQFVNFSYPVSGGKTVTGTRYSVTANGVIASGGGSSFFPGSAAGSAATGGQYL